MATKTPKKRQSQEQKLLDAVTHAASCLKEAGEPPRSGLGKICDRCALGRV